MIDEIAREFQQTFEFLLLIRDLISSFNYFLVLFDTPMSFTEIAR